MRLAYEAFYLAICDLRFYELVSIDEIEKEFYFPKRVSSPFRKDVYFF